MISWFLSSGFQYLCDVAGCGIGSLLRASRYFEYPPFWESSEIPPTPTHLVIPIRCRFRRPAYSFSVDFRRVAISPSRKNTRWPFAIENPPADILSGDPFQNGPPSRAIALPRTLWRALHFRPLPLLLPSAAAPYLLLRKSPTHHRPRIFVS